MCGLGSLSDLLIPGTAKLTGNLPTELGLLTKVTKIDLEVYCQFIGPLPTELGTLSKMAAFFHVRSNLLTSTLPTQLGGAFAGLYGSDGFDVALNDLSGPIPTEYGRMTELRAFDAKSRARKEAAVLRERRRII